MSEYTKGPWFIVERDLLHNEKEVLVKSEKQQFPTWVACISETENQLANAKLIAAAPELLAACKEALYQLQGMDSSCTMLLKEAIKKAEGEHE